MQLILMFIIFALVGLPGLAGRARQPEVATIEKQLVVTGSSKGLASFVALQGSRRPALATSTPVAIRGGRLQAVVSLPAGFTGTELIHTTREALAAGLDYRYEERRFTPAPTA